MGHSTTRAALIYLHGGDQRQRTIADAVSNMAQTALRREPGKTAGSPPLAKFLKAATICL